LTSALHFKCDWRFAQDYDYTTDLTKEQWAWQFLRRNPEYQQDWHCFIRRWRELEEAYGVAPHRDFPRWKTDPRAYAAEYDTGALCAENLEGMTLIDADKILIECWMGIKWGFYKFPLNPAYSLPQIPQELLWREQAIDLENIAQQALLENTHITLIHFDLNLSLKEQLLKAKQQLAREKRALQTQGLLKCYISDYSKEWTLLLRYLDAVQLGEKTNVIEEVLQMEGLVRKADKMLNRGYLALLLLH